MNVVDFLTARIDEDEAIIDGRWQAEEIGYPMDDETREWVSRLQSEVAAKRRLMEALPEIGPATRSFVLRALASVYAGHPDYPSITT